MVDKMNEKGKCFWCDKEFAYSVDDPHQERETIDRDGVWYFWDEYECPHCGGFTKPS